MKIDNWAIFKGSFMGAWFQNIRFPYKTKENQDPAAGKMLPAQSYGKALGDFLRMHSVSFAYRSSFDVIPADTSELRDRGFRLRHKVFCDEHGYELPPEPGIYIEYDKYDQKAKHFLLQHRLSHEIAATVRVILPDEHDPDFIFPAQELCDYPLFADQPAPPRLCEISKFCTAPRFRNREEDGRFLSAYSELDVIRQEDGQNARNIRRAIPYLQAGLLRAVFETALHSGITDCLWLVEAGHLPSLKRMGFAYHILGAEIPKYGGLYPIVFNITQVLESMESAAPHCWILVSDGGRLQDVAQDVYNKYGAGFSYPPDIGGHS